MLNGFLKICFSFILIFTLENAIFAKSNFTFEIRGVQGQVLKNINLRLSSLQQNYNKTLSANQAGKVTTMGKSEIKKAMEPYGFFRAHIQSQLTYKNGQWKAIYNISPGQPLYIDNLSISLSGEGKDNEKINRYINKHPLKSGVIFNTTTYDEFKTKLFQIARNQGYLKSYFKNKILIDLVRYTCQITIHLETGPQFYFGHVEFKKFPYSQNFMERCLTVHAGDVFSSDKLLKLQQQMEKSYYFKRAVFKPDFSNMQNFSIPIDAYLFAPSARSYSAGIGYGTLTGPRISAGLSLRHLGDEGHHLEAEVKLSKILKGIGTTYYIPGKNPLTDEWLMGINYKSFSPKAGKSDSITFTGGYSKKFKNWQTSLNLNYLREKFIIYGEPSWEYPHVLYPSWKTSYIRADNIANPQNAFSANLTVQAASKAILSTSDFASVQTRIKTILTPFSFGRFIFRIDAGAIDTSNLQVFPLSLRFFAGGINSIRGFADSSIGPGKYLGVASGEYQQRVKGDLFAAVFYDLGNATNHVHTPLNRGAGIGMVYDTRVGPFKIYLARALSKQTKPYSVEFSLGPEFS